MEIANKELQERSERVRPISLLSPKILALTTLDYYVPSYHVRISRARALSLVDVQQLHEVQEVPNQVNEVQKIGSRSYNVPDEINEEDLQAGTLFNPSLKRLPRFTNKTFQSWMHFQPLILRLRISMTSSRSPSISTWNYFNKMDS